VTPFFAALARPRKRRRTPVDWRRYATHVRRAQKRLPRYEHPLAVRLAISLVFTVAGIALLQALGVRVGSGFADLGAEIVGALPKAQEGELVLGETTVTVSAAPILEGIPDFTKTNQLPITGRVPSFFAVRPERKILLSLNGRVVGTYPIATDGRFGGAPVTLPDGPSTVTATLVEGATEIASTSHTVVVDRVPPVLSITRPKANDTVDGPDIIVEGKTEAGADVSVNDRALRPNPDGTFTERLTAAPGLLALTIVARDKAGNETKTELSITVKQSSQTTIAGTALTVTLDRTKVRPGETVVAKVVATDSGKPKADLAITLQVGVITLGTYKTDSTGVANIGFAAPDHEVTDVAVVVLGGGASARATLTVSTK
jgi:hypothetical protein